MPPSMGSNIDALRASRSLTAASQSLGRVFERLSSGQRINRASDDSAGLAVASSLSVTRRVYAQGIRNLNDGISALSIADGALNELVSVVTRIRELATQAANGALSFRQREAIDAEAQELREEFFRISRSTKFNGIGLFDGSIQQLGLQGGYGVNGAVISNLGGSLGDGTFGAATSYTTETTESISLALGDFNNDGVQDLATLGTSAGTVVTIRLGSGDGTFGAAYSMSIVSLSYAQSLVAGDINNDGVLDLVMSGDNGVQGKAVVRLGLGNGTFSSEVSYSTNHYDGSESSVTLGDLNEDGILDMVVAGVSALAGTAEIRLGNGDGTFGAAVSYTTEGLSHGVVLGDLNNDGRLDLITSGAALGVGYATVRLGNGNGTFGTATSFTMGSGYARSPSLGDLNSDGRLDLVTVAGGNQIYVRLGNGDGTFQAETSYAMGTATSGESVALGDLNGDGALDVLASGSTPTGILGVRLGQGDGSFGNVTTYSSEGSNSYAVGVADLNRDGVLDVITAGDSGPGYATVRLGSTRYGLQPLLDFSLTTKAGASQAMGTLETKLNLLTSQRGAIGSFQSRLQAALQTLGGVTENYAAAESRIRDADVAFETAQLARLNILQQTATAVLAQANLSNELVLQLLGR